LPEIEARLEEFGYSTGDPDPERALREAEARIQREAEAKRRDAADVVDYQVEKLHGLISRRGDEAMLRVSPAEARLAEEQRRRASEDEREERAREVYGQRTQHAVALVDRMQEVEDDEPSYPRYPGHAAR
jgi:hypothetical protein